MQPDFDFSVRWKIRWWNWNAVIAFVSESVWRESHVSLRNWCTRRKGYYVGFCRFRFGRQLLSKLLLWLLGGESHDDAILSVCFHLFCFKIYDGHNVNSSQVGRYCGEQKPPRAVSSYNAMFLVFQSDASISGRGFKANYSLIDIRECWRVLN